jgi:hypothetical protein
VLVRGKFCKRELVQADDVEDCGVVGDPLEHCKRVGGVGEMREWFEAVENMRGGARC